jgi:four helix bundle protein
METKNTVQSLSLEFSIQLLGIESKLSSSKIGLHSNQIMRSGTAIGALIREAQGAESRKDFIHKMKIAYKEAEETEYWLALFVAVNQDFENSQVLDLLIQIKKMLSKIISSTVRNMNNTKGKEQLEK